MTIGTSEIENKRARSDRRDADRRQIVRRSANEHVDLERRRADFRRGLQRRMLARRSRQQRGVYCRKSRATTYATQEPIKKATAVTQLETFLATALETILKIRP